MISQIEVPEPEVKVGHPVEYSHSSLIRFHVYRFAKGGWSVEKLLREMHRDWSLAKLFGMPRIPSRSTLSVRSPALVWQSLWQQVEAAKVLILDASLIGAGGDDGEAGWGLDYEDNWVYGYKVYLLLDADSGAIWGVEVEAANANESPIGRQIIEQLPLQVDQRELQGVILADAIFDVESTALAADLRGYTLLTPTNLRRGKTEPQYGIRRDKHALMQLPVAKQLYKRRTEIERVFGLLKEVFALDNFRSRGILALRTHVLACLTTFSLLAQTLAQLNYPILWASRVAA
jgi:hypothetical protein